MMNKLFTLLFVLLSSSLVAQNWEVLAEDVDYRIEKSHIICNSTQGYDYDFILLNFDFNSLGKAMLFIFILI